MHWVRQRLGLNRPKPSGRVVVLIHGLSMPSAQMIPMARGLAHQGRLTKNLTYRHLFEDVPETALHIAEQLRALGVEEFDAITHSMGAIVLRWALNHAEELPRLRRAVMIAPPSNGAWIAGHLHHRLGPGFPLIFGQAGVQMRKRSQGVACIAGTLPDSEVGVIAGGAGSPMGLRNWFKIPGDCDGTVAVEETVFPGMKDFMLLPSSHTWLPFHRDAVRLSATFLEHGVFRPGARRRSH